MERLISVENIVTLREQQRLRFYVIFRIELKRFNISETMAKVLLHLLPVLWLLNAVHTSSDCTMKRTSSLRFSANSTVNELGQRTVSVEGLSEAHETDSVGVSVDHWTANCHDLQVVGLQLNVTGPNSNIDTLVVTDMAVPELTTELQGNTTEQPIATELQGNTTEQPIVTELQGNTTEQPIAALSCRSGYELLPGDGCYKLINQFMTWDEARLNCERLGDLLAVPETEQELDSLTKMVDRYGSFNSWMGIHKTDEQWTTVDGSSSFSSWSPRGPYHQGNCVIIYSEGLADFPCSSTERSICEQRRP